MSGSGQGFGGIGNAPKEVAEGQSELERAVESMFRRVHSWVGMGGRKRRVVSRTLYTQEALSQAPA
jgi:hypothetical protein